MKIIPAIHLHNIVNAMLMANSKIAHPKIRLELTNGQLIVLKLATSTSRFPGSINIDDGKPFNSNKWFGRILKTGELQLSAIGETIEQPLKELLAAFNKNPETVAKIYGQKYNHCCFCGLTLKNADSVAAGYGPICAENYGLPWHGMAKVKRDEEIETSVESGFNLDFETQILIHDESTVKILNSIDKTLALWHDDKLSSEETLIKIKTIIDEFNLSGNK